MPNFEERYGFRPDQFKCTITRVPPVIPRGSTGQIELAATGKAKISAEDEPRRLHTQIDWRIVGKEAGLSNEGKEGAERLVQALRREIEREPLEFDRKHLWEKSLYDTEDHDFLEVASLYSNENDDGPNDEEEVAIPAGALDAFGRSSNQEDATSHGSELNLTAKDDSIPSFGEGAHAPSMQSISNAIRGFRSKPTFFDEYKLSEDHHSVIMSVIPVGGSNASYSITACVCPTVLTEAEPGDGAGKPGRIAYNPPSSDLREYRDLEERYERLTGAVLGMPLTASSLNAIEGTSQELSLYCSLENLSKSDYELACAGSFLPQEDRRAELKKILLSSGDRDSESE